MSKILYSILALVLLAACSNDDFAPDNPLHGELVSLLHIGIGSNSRGEIVDGDFEFRSGDKVLVTAQTGSNTFTFDGSNWEQDVPPTEGNKSIYVQNNSSILSIVSYGGKATAESDYADQSTAEKYALADELKAEQSDISYNNGSISATLSHTNIDFIIKVADGDITLPSEAVLKVVINSNGEITYTTWNVGKNNGTSIFRVILPADCTIIKAIIYPDGNISGTGKNIIFKNSSGSKIFFEAGKRYEATYTYNTYKPAVPNGWTPIYTAEDLAKIGVDTEKHPDNGKYILMNNIDLQNINWAPLPEFKGLFNGNGKTISNLKIDATYTTTANVGLFSSLNGGTIYDLHIEDVYINVSGTSYTYVGAIVGNLGSGRIDKCSVIDGEVKCSGGDLVYTGGFAGSFNGGIITRSWIKRLTITAISNSYAYAGGIIGGDDILNNNNTGLIAASYVIDPNIIATSSSSQCAGGIIGYTEGSTENSNIVYGSYALNVAVTSQNIATLIGANNGYLISCYATNAATSSAKLYGDNIKAYACVDIDGEPIGEIWVMGGYKSLIDTLALSGWQNKITISPITANPDGSFSIGEPVQWTPLGIWGEITDPTTPPEINMDYNGG